MFRKMQRTASFLTRWEPRGDDSVGTERKEGVRRMSQSALEALSEELKGACKKKGITAFAIESAFEVAEGMRGERERQLSVFSTKEASTGHAYDLLLLFDVVAATASLEAASVGAVKDGPPAASEVIDLWIRATAGRALWYERFVQWPQENSAKKLEHLRDTARKLGAESIARGLLEGVQLSKFTEFVRRFS